jgi:hypothetical protein
MIRSSGSKVLVLRCLVLLLVAGLTGLGCDDEGENYLKGSLVKNYHIKFNDVRVRLYDSGLSIEYTSNSTEGVVALKVTINTTQAQLIKGKTYDLVEYGDITRDNGFGTLPRVLESGSLTLDEYNSKEGGEVVGSFEAKMETDTGSLQSIRGGFSAKLEIVNI